MTEMEQTISELMKIAEVSSDRREEAREWLADHLTPGPVGAVIKSRALTLFDAVNEKPVPSDINDPLDRVRLAASELKAALEALRVHPYASNPFWLFDGSEDLKGFGPVYGSDFERGHLDVLNTMIAASEAATKKGRTGRPAKSGKQRIANLAARFLRKFAPHIPKTNSKANQFTERFYEAVVGTRATLDKQRLRAQRR